MLGASSKGASAESKGAFIHVDPYDNPGLLQHLQYTVLWSIWPSMLLFTAIAAALTAVHENVHHVNITISPTMLTVLGTVLGFCISYRTSSAYERYIEGRKLWQQVQTATRLASRIIWFHCPNQTSLEVADDKKETDAARALLEKKTMLNMLEAFAVALKHYLRGESGIHYTDLYHLVLFLPKYQLPSSTPIHRTDLHEPGHSQGGSTPDNYEGTVTPADTLTSKEHVHFRRRQVSRKSTGVSETPTLGPRFPDKPLLPAHNPPKFNIIDDVFPALAVFRSLFKFGRKHVAEMLDVQSKQPKKQKHKKNVYLGANIPVEITLHISSWISALQKRKTVDVATINALLNSNASLSEALSGLERVLTTPLPLPYGLHLKHTTYLYLLFLPFQILPTLGWITIPAVAVASFIFTGFLHIGDMIEQPLGYDSADLDLGFFCDAIRKELRELVAQPPADPDDFFFSYCNEPLAPGDNRSAAELVEDGVSVREIEEALSKGHADSTGFSRSFTECNRVRSKDSAHVSREGTSPAVSTLAYMPTVKNESPV